MQRDSLPNSASLNGVSEVFHLYDPPLWLVTACHEGSRGGLIATFAVRASIVRALPRMVIGIAKHHYTWRLIEGSGRFALHLLAADDLEAVWRFGLQSGYQADKFVDLPDRRTVDGNPLFPRARSWLDCRVEERMDIGDRTVYVAEVSGGDVLAPGPVLGVGALLDGAPPEHRAKLDRLYAADQVVDTAAILAWRRARRDT
jgi:flavin reductase (DIM6/NTAB) family NADH-FMN oxidoreductase RutF